MGASCCISERQGTEVTVGVASALQQKGGKGAHVEGGQRPQPPQKEKRSRSERSSKTEKSEKKTRDASDTSLTEEKRSRPERSSKTETSEKNRDASDRSPTEEAMDDKATRGADNDRKAIAEKKATTAKDLVESPDPGPKRRSVPSDKVTSAGSLPSGPSMDGKADKPSAEDLPNPDKVASAGDIPKWQSMRGQDPPESLPKWQSGKDIEAATKIQAAFRGMRGRDEVKTLREEKHMEKAREEVKSLRETKRVSIRKDEPVTMKKREWSRSPSKDIKDEEVQSIRSQKEAQAREKAKQEVQSMREARRTSVRKDEPVTMKQREWSRSPIRATQDEEAAKETDDKKDATSAKNPSSSLGRRTSRVTDLNEDATSAKNPSSSRGRRTSRVTDLNEDEAAAKIQSTFRERRDARKKANDTQKEFASMKTRSSHSGIVESKKSQKEKQIGEDASPVKHRSSQREGRDSKTKEKGKETRMGEDEAATRIQSSYREKRERRAKERAKDAEKNML